MGAEVPYRIHVKRLVDDVVEVSAVTLTEAILEAGKLEGVACVVGRAAGRRVTRCLGCNADVSERDCGCPAGTYESEEYD